MRPKPLAQGILTILRDAETNRGDFIFFTDRLATLLVEKATELLPYRAKSVITPVGVEAHGKQVDVPVGPPSVLCCVGLSSSVTAPMWCVDLTIVCLHIISCVRS